MDFGDVPAWAAAGVAFVAAIIAVVAARYSKRQAQAAEDQAKSADEQAQAAKDQVALLRKQIDMAEQDRHEQNAPRFAVTWTPFTESYDDGAWFTIAYAEGPPRLDKVTVALAAGSGAEGLTLDENERPEHPSVELASMAGGTGQKFIASINIHVSDVVFLVTAQAGSGTWGPVPVTAREV